MKTTRITTVVGARPQFVKAAAVSRAIARLNERSGAGRIVERIVHTGQHYDRALSGSFFEDLRIPPPAENLEVGSGPHGQQTGRMLERLEVVLAADRPDWVVIHGDTNSTLAGAVAAAKMHLPVAHVEAGLRSFNRRMPEEINRVVADHLSTLLLCPTARSLENLAREGIERGVHRVGDVMYDSVRFHADLAEARSDVMSRLGLEPRSYHLATIHRAENTDDADRLEGIFGALSRLDRPVVVPLHPRTRERLPAGRLRAGGNVRVVEPVAYLDMITLERNCRLVLTDSGGVQKEAYWFARPCVTLREETEWVELVEAGCNRLVGARPEAILDAVAAFEEAGGELPADRPGDLYGDGRAAERLVEVLASDC